MWPCGNSETSPKIATASVPQIASREMHRNRIDRIVDLEPFEEMTCHVADDAADGADQHGRASVDDVAIGGDGDETCENAVERLLHIRQPAREPAEPRGGEAASAAAASIV